LPLQPDKPIINSNHKEKVKPSYIMGGRKLGGLDMNWDMDYWQVQAGEGKRKRDYCDVFLNFGVVLVDSAEHGSVEENREWYEKNRPIVIRFHDNVNVGDVVILKRPHGERWEIVAVGRVTGDYEYCQLFDDVEGWDLRHCRKVQWTRPASPLYVCGLSRGTFKAVKNRRVRRKADEVLEKGERCYPEKLPRPGREISKEQLVKRLIESGLRRAHARPMIEAITMAAQLAGWYSKYGEDVSENETRTFLIVPMLLALGWKEKQMKIEWNDVDIAFFEEQYGRDDEPVMILESKRLWEGLSAAEKQVKEYAKEFPKCSRLIISDGVCYRLYIRANEGWKWKAYCNLLRLKNCHPYQADIEGAPTLFSHLIRSKDKLSDK